MVCCFIGNKGTNFVFNFMFVLMTDKRTSLFDSLPISVQTRMKAAGVTEPNRTSNTSSLPIRNNELGASKRPYLASELVTDFTSRLNHTRPNTLQMYVQKLQFKLF